MKEPQLTPKKVYLLDIDTISSLEDVKTILKGMNLAITEDNSMFGILKPYFKTSKTMINDHIK